MPAEDDPDGAQLARNNFEVFLKVIQGARFAEPNPRPMFPNPYPGPVGIEPQSPGLRDRIWWGAGNRKTAEWAAELGVNLQSSTLVMHESNEPFHVQQRKQIEAYKAKWKELGHEREPRVSVSRSIFALVDEQDWQLFGHDRESEDQVGAIPGSGSAIFGRSYAGPPDQLVEELKEDEAIQAAGHPAPHDPVAAGGCLLCKGARRDFEACGTRVGLAISIANRVRTPTAPAAP